MSWRLYGQEWKRVEVDVEEGSEGGKGTTVADNTLPIQVSPCWHQFQQVLP